MSEIKARIYLEDDAPKIGSGWRLVTIKTGYKWAKLTSLENGAKQRIPMELLEKIYET